MKIKIEDVKDRQIIPIHKICVLSLTHKDSNKLGERKLKQIIKKTFNEKQ